MSAQDIIEALPTLSPRDRLAIHDRLTELDDVEVEVSQEEQEAIEAGILSSQSGAALSPEVMRQQLAGWLAK